MKSKWILPVLALGMLAISSCRKVIGRGDVITENRSIQNFTEVSSGINAKVYVTIQPDFDVEITAEENIVNAIQTNLSANKLEIKTKTGTILRPNDDIIIRIGLPALKKMIVSGSGDAFVQNTVTGDKVGFYVSGSGSISVEDVLLSNELHAEVSGSGDIYFENGEATNIDLDGSGSGEVDAANVQGIDGNIHLSGSGSTRVWLSGSLEGHISGSGSIYYRGDPAIDAHVSGSGKIKKI